MAQIYQMSTHLSNLIAAGEVVERPASVAKELVENALDSGADRICVEMRDGGVTYLRVSDNGCGIEREDMKTAFLRHASSKLTCEEQLNQIQTLGFRGEALAAIAAVSQVEALSKTAQAPCGSRLTLDAGQVTGLEDEGCVDGTTVIVRNLFFNTPARMKFLKRDATEAGYITTAVERAALCHPGVSFQCIKDGKDVFQTPGNGDLAQCIHAIYGKKFLEDMEPLLPFCRDDIAVSGFVGKPHAAKGSRSHQLFFINGRPVRSGLLQAALEQAYRNCVMTGKFPYCVLMLDVPYAQVDVNVHPAKTEVKFMQEKGVFDAVYAACKNTLEQMENRPRVQLTSAQSPQPAIQPPPAPEQITIAPGVPPALADAPAPAAAPAQTVRVTPPQPRPGSGFLPFVDCDREEGADLLRQSGGSAFQLWEQSLKQQPVPESTPAESQPPAPAPETGERAPAGPEQAATASPWEDDFVYIGECFQTYLLAQQGERLLLIDKHAAHERILFNQLMADGSSVEGQSLLTPEPVRLAREQYQAVLDSLPLLESLGFGLEDFGQGYILVRQIPTYLPLQEAQSALEQLAQQLTEQKNPALRQRDELLHSIACKAAIKAGFLSSREELEALCRRVLSDPAVLACPHGRPVTVELSREEIEKFFRRIV